jgi:hypothetical protein
MAQCWLQARTSDLIAGANYDEFDGAADKKVVLIRISLCTVAEVFVGC